MQYWLHAFLDDEKDKSPGGVERACCSFALAKFQHLLDSNGPWFDEPTRKDVCKYGRTFLLFYQSFATQFQGAYRKNFKVTPKFHYFCHMLISIARTERNVRYEHTYTDECLMGKISAIASKTHALTLEHTSFNPVQSFLGANRLVRKGVLDHEPLQSIVPPKKLFWIAKRKQGCPCGHGWSPIQ